MCAKKHLRKGNILGWTSLTGTVQYTCSPTKRCVKDPCVNSFARPIFFALTCAGNDSSCLPNCGLDDTFLRQNMSVPAQKGMVSRVVEQIFLLVRQQGLESYPADMTNTEHEFYVMWQNTLTSLFPKHWESFRNWKLHFYPLSFHKASAVWPQVQQHNRPVLRTESQSLEYVPSTKSTDEQCNLGCVTLLTVTTLENRAFPDLFGCETMWRRQRKIFLEGEQPCQRARIGTKSH